jgi:hypothetical protein
MVRYRSVASRNAAIVNVPLETTLRYWSDPKSWDSGMVPKEGEDVEINPGKNFIFDLEESPLYNMI